MTRHEIREAYLKELDEIASYPQNWDGEGALPLNWKVKENAIKVINGADPDALSEWGMSPNINGSLYFSSKYGSINLGNSGFSYYFYMAGKYHGSDYTPFSAEAVIKIIESL